MGNAYTAENEFLKYVARTRIFLRVPCGTASIEHPVLSAAGHSANFLLKEATDCGRQTQ